MKTYWAKNLVLIEILEYGGKGKTQQEEMTKIQLVKVSHVSKEVMVENDKGRVGRAAHQR